MAKKKNLLRAAERLMVRQKNRKDCGWKCETEGEGGSEERENGKQAEKYWHFISR